MRCKNHPKYKAIQVPSINCKGCWLYFQEKEPVQYSLITQVIHKIEWDKKMKEMEQEEIQSHYDSGFWDGREGGEFEHTHKSTYEDRYGELNVK